MKKIAKNGSTNRHNKQKYRLVQNYKTQKKREGKTKNRIKKTTNKQAANKIKKRNWKTTENKKE